MRNAVLSALLISAAAPAANAVVLYGLDNTANRTDPGTGAPWESVAKVTKSDAVGLSGSAVYLGNGYMVTANHVDLSSGYVSFDGAATYAIDTSFASVQLASGGVSADAKVFRLASAPIGISGARLLSSASEKFWTSPSGANRSAAAVTLVGWGVGRNATATGAGLVGWDFSTSAKRWGSNTLNNYSLVAAESRPAYDFITTHTGTDSSTEAGATYYDSGSGLFQQISGTWYMVGLTALVSNRGGDYTTTFAAEANNGSNGDENLFVRMSSYSAQIASITAVPEPSDYAKFAAFATLAISASRRLQRRKRADRAA